MSLSALPCLAHFPTHADLPTHLILPSTLTSSRPCAATLRFAVGDPVLVSNGRGKREQGVVVKHKWTKEGFFPPGFCAAYQVKVGEQLRFVRMDLDIQVSSMAMMLTSLDVDPGA